MTEKMEWRMQELALALHTDSDDVMLDVQGTQGERLGIHMSLNDLAKVHLVLTRHLQSQQIAGALRAASAPPATTAPLHHVADARLELVEWTLGQLTLLISPAAEDQISVDIPYEAVGSLIQALRTFLANRVQ